MPCTSRGRFTPTSVQLRPSSRVTCTRPSSVPAQMTPGVTGDSAIVMSVAWVSACVTSRVRPPLSGFVKAVSAVDRSGLMISQVSPRS